MSLLNSIVVVYTDYLYAAVMVVCTLSRRENQSQGLINKRTKQKWHFQFVNIYLIVKIHLLVTFDARYII